MLLVAIATYSMPANGRFLIQFIRRNMLYRTDFLFRDSAMFCIDCEVVLFSELLR